MALQKLSSGMNGAALKWSSVQKASQASSPRRLRNLGIKLNFAWRGALCAYTQKEAFVRQQRRGGTLQELW